MNKRIVSALAAGLLAAPAAAAPVRTVSVVGTGSVQVVPNVASVSVQIVNQGGVKAAPMTLAQENQARVAESLPVIKELVGRSGTVRVVPSISKVTAYNRSTGETEFKGYQALTQIQVTLRGEAAVAGKLGALFDASRIKADEVSVTGIGLSDRREAAAKRRALSKAMADARNQAEAQLEKGEKLGAALSRGQAVQVHAPRMARAAVAQSLEMAADGGSGMTAELGRVTVPAQTTVTYAVKGKAKRLK